MRSRSVLTTGGSIAAAVVFSLVLQAIGLLPVVLSDQYDVAYRFTAHAGSDAPKTAPSYFELEGQGFECQWFGVPSQPLARNATPSAYDVRCITVDTDGQGLRRLEAALKRSGWGTASSGIEMDMQRRASAGWVLLSISAFILMALVLARASSEGWGWGSLARLRWRVVPLLLAPFLSAAVVVFIGSLWLGPAQGQAAPLAGGMAGSMAGVPLFYLMPLVAALPEEAMFRGWLHERLFGRLPAWLAYLVIAELFLLLHLGLVAAMFSGGASAAVAVVQAAGVFCISLALTWVRCRSGSLGLCVLAHAISNLGAMAMVLAG
ncbi:MAG: lysostaphin resistance A-like protein [Silanimonas lenta]